MAEREVWKATACNLCECNCGIEVQLGGADGRRFTKIRGDKRHPASRGYACEKPHRLDYYQNGRDRILQPLRRRKDGGFEEIDWNTAIGEVAERLASIRDTYGGESIFYYGGGGQGNHLPAGYARATRAVLGSRYRSNALAQEKTGEFWVNGRMLGTMVRGDFEHCEVAMFVGKNPWQSHSIPRARVTLKSIARDPGRSMIVIDPRRSETAELADYHLAVRPGCDAWLLAAMAALIVQEKLYDDAWVAEHTTDAEAIMSLLADVPVDEYARIAGLDPGLVREATRRLARASSVASFEDLGVQMNRHSTLVSYLHRMIWVLTGNFGKKGAQYVPTSIVSLAGGEGGSDTDKRSPVTGSRIIGGLVPCNVIPDEILTDHPRRFRAMLCESANPAHSLADGPRMREALTALDCLVVIDVAMSETARLADYVLPTPTQFEKFEATFFNFDFPRNCFHLRRPVLDPPPGPLAEPEIHARLVEALGEMPAEVVATLRRALESGGRPAFAAAFQEALADDPPLFRIAPVLLYRTLGPALPHGAAAAAALWGAAQMCAAQYADSIHRAGIEGEGPELGDNLFDAMLDSPHGLVFSEDPYEESWKRVRTPDGRIHMLIPELLDELRGLSSEQPPAPSKEFPFVLSAGERRSFTANTILRDPAWRKKAGEVALRLSPVDAERLGVDDGARVRVTTKRGSAEVLVEVSDRMQPGHVSLPNGSGIAYPQAETSKVPPGVAPNDLTCAEDRDWLAGTPWHKSVPACIEPL